jgi:hypothetical protein
VQEGYLDANYIMSGTIGRTVFHNVVHKISNGSPILVTLLQVFYIMFDWQLVIHMKNFIHDLKRTLLWD